MYKDKNTTTKELAEQLNTEDTLRRRWIWVFFGITTLLLILLILLFRGLCTDVWYIKLIGAPSTCGGTTAVLPEASTGLSLKDLKLTLNGNSLTIAGTNTTVVLPGTNGLPGAAGVNGASGTNGLNGTNGSNGTAGPIGPVGPPGPNVVTNTLVSGGNGITSTVNGVSSGAANIINSIGNTSAGNVLTTTVNGISGAGVSIINSNTLSLTQGGGLSSTVNGVAATQLIPAGNVSTIIGFDGVGNPVNQSLAGLACDPTGNYFCQNGNNFGTQAVFGTTDNNSISTIVNGNQQFTTREGGMDINPNAATTNPDGNWYTIRIKDMTNLFENGIYIYDEGTFQAGSFDLATGFQANFFTVLPGNGIGYPPGAYQASYDGSTVQTYNWIAPNSYVIGNTRFDANPTTFQGAQYIADYSANYVPLSLITLQDLTNALAVISVNNGLTNNAGTLQLGGGLVQNTSIDNNGFQFTINGNIGFPLFFIDPAVNQASIGDYTGAGSGTSVIVTDATQNVTVNAATDLTVYSPSTYLSGILGVGVTPLTAMLEIGSGTSGIAGTGGVLVNGTAGSPALSVAGTGRIYFDSGLNTFQCSENGSIYSTCFNTNIYSANGTLTSNRTLDGGSNNLEFVAVSNFTIGPNSGEPLFHIDSAGTASLGDDNNWNGGTRITVNTNTQDVIFYTNNVERGRFESGGEFLINTTSPVAGKVAVFNGDVNVTGVIDPTALLFSDTTGVSSYDPALNNGYRIGVTGATQRAIFFSPLSDSTDVFQIRNTANVAFFDADSTNGRIGIGTNTPAQKLDVNGDALINGIRAGLGNSSLATNTAFGFNSLSVNSIGTQNTGIGYLALAANTTATRNTAIGWNALAAVDTGGSNTAVGGNALALATNGSQNTAVGRGALQAITSGGNNNGIGVLAMGQQQTGTNNIAIGNSAMNVANGASQNVVIGVLASNTQTTGSTNTIIGYNTGGGLTTGGANTIIGANVNGLAAGTSNNVIIADGSGNRRIVVDAAGNLGIANTAPGFRLHVGSAAIASGTTVSRFQNAGGTCDVTPNVAGGITCTSDITLKKNIEEYDGGLGTILALDTISYNMKADLDGTQKQIGFSAQDLEKVLPGLVQTDSDGYKSVSYAGLTPILTSGLKELNSKFEAAILASDGKLDATNKILTDSGVRIDSLSDDLKQLTKRVDSLEQQNLEYKKELEEVKNNNVKLEKRLEKLEQTNLN